MVLLCAYFLSQSGFINRLIGGSIHSPTIDYDRLKTSEDPMEQIYFHDTYLSKGDVLSSAWLSTYKNESIRVYADYEAGTHVLISYGLVPKQLIGRLSNATYFEEDSLVYLDSLNIINGLVPTYQETFNYSQVQPILANLDIIYSNYASEILYTPPR